MNYDESTEQGRFWLFVKKNGGLTAVSRKTGGKISAQRMSNYIHGSNKSLGSDLIRILNHYFPEFNIAWWLNAKGDMNRFSETDQLAVLLKDNPDLLKKYEVFHKDLGELLDLTRLYMKKPHV